MLSLLAPWIHADDKWPRLINFMALILLLTDIWYFLKYLEGLCIVLCCFGLIPIMFTHLLWDHFTGTNSIACWVPFLANLMNLGKYFTWVHLCFEYNHNKQNKQCAYFKWHIKHVAQLQWSQIVRSIPHDICLIKDTACLRYKNPCAVHGIMMVIKVEPIWHYFVHLYPFFSIVKLFRNFTHYLSNFCCAVFHTSLCPHFIIFSWLQINI